MSIVTIGTPDYLAPEILNRQPHSYPVDWWGLGICLFELLVGIPPFTDQTPEKVFENILSHNLEFPEGDERLSPQAEEAICCLLSADPDKRPQFKVIKNHFKMSEHLD